MIQKLVVAGLVSLIIAGCNSGSSGSGTGKINLAFSDAPVDGENKVVCIAFDEITVHHVNGSESSWRPISFAADQSSDICIPEAHTIPQDDVSGDPKFMVIALTDYKGEESLQVLSDEELEAGKYTQMRLSVMVDEYYHDDPRYPLSFIAEKEIIEGVEVAVNPQPIGVPSGKLKLDGFDVQEDVTQAYTLEFDLRKSMVLNSNGYQLKPRGVRLVNNESVATISGDVTADACGTEGLDHAYVYVYTAPTDGNYGDLGSDSEPYTSVAVNIDEVDGSGTFEVGYVPLGGYDIVLVCDGSADDPDSPGDLTIAPDSDTDPDPAFKGEILTKDGLFVSF